MKVFHCQHCKRAFQASADSAGRKLRCPSCDGLNTIPADAADHQPAVDTAETHQVFACPGCQGQFQVAVQASEQTVACPHCQASVRIPGRATTASDPPLINTKPKRRSGRPSSLHRGAAFVPPEEQPDRFAPGFRPKSEQPSSAKPEPHADQSKTGKRSGNPSDNKTPAATGNKLPLPKPAGKPGEGIGKPTAPLPERPAESLATDKVEPISASAEVRQSIDHLLPPKFAVEDPDQLAVKVSRENHKVLLPDGRGGTAQIDKRVVRVQHGEDTVSLVVLTPQQKSRRRMIRNVITILIAIAMMAFAFWWLK